MSPTSQPVKHRIFPLLVRVSEIGFPLPAAVPSAWMLLLNEPFSSKPQVTSERQADMVLGPANVSAPASAS